jgi:hypothetical protein
VQQTIERDREALAALIVQLKEAQHVAGVLEINGNPIVGQDSIEVWDDIINETITQTESGPAPAPAPISSSAFDQDDPMNIDKEPAPGPTPAHSSVPAPDSATSSPSPVPVEDQILFLPSNGNVRPIHGDLECSFRITVAEHHLTQIRNLIVEKSFQFSHIIRASPRKSVTTRSRASVKKINSKIAFHCRLYSRCRDRFVALGADEATKSRLRILSPDDIKSSGAIVNPNQPGSTKLKLSWIWQSAGGHRWGLSNHPVHRAGTGAGSSSGAGRSTGAGTSSGAGASSEADGGAELDDTYIECKSFSFSYFYC